MTGTLSPESLTGVSKTLLIPLLCRAWEYQQPEPILKDDFCYELVERLKPLLAASEDPFHQGLLQARWPKFLPVIMSLRARHFDQVTEAFIRKYPAAQVVMLGCGLDSRFERLGRPAVPWINLDLPAVMALRQQLFEPAPDVRNLAISVLDPRWLEQIDASRPTLIQAEGLVMYLPRSQVRSLFQQIAGRFYGELLVEVLAHWAVEAIGHFVLQRSVDLSQETVFVSGVRSSQEPASWHPSLHYLGDWTYYEHYQPRLGLINLLGYTPLKRVQWIIHYALNGTGRCDSKGR